VAREEGSQSLTEDKPPPRLRQGGGKKKHLNGGQRKEGP